MVIDMLEAISDMLNQSEEVKVQCAKLMLDKIISGLVKNPEEVEKELKFNPPQNKKKVIPQQDQIAIVPNDDGTIKDIIGMDDDGKIELDGVVYTRKEAIGRKFQNGRIL